MKIYFGAGGSAVAYCNHTNSIPDFFADNDGQKWGKKLLGREILSPKELEKIDKKRVTTIVITTSYLKDVLPQIKNLGFESQIIEIPPKSLMGLHPFTNLGNRIETADILGSFIAEFPQKKILLGGGACLGICREKDFIKWDIDVDLFASIELHKNIFQSLKERGWNPYVELDSIKFQFELNNKTIVPNSIDFFDPNKNEFLDVYENYSWKWPIDMFTQPTKYILHNNEFHLPNPVENYLAGVYGLDWKVAKPEFKHCDYGP